MHEPIDAPPAAAAGELARSARHTVPIVLVVVAAVCAAYAPLLGHWFYSDDFVHLLNNRDLGWQGFFRFLAFADYGDRPWVYWRPGWMLLFQLVFSVAGTTAWPYYLVALLLHAAAAAVVTVLGMRLCGSSLLGLGAGFLFALAPSHCEAVAWISATYNVIPAAICLFLAGAASWRFAHDGGAGRGTAIVLLVGASLTFKEAAYGFPLVFAAACVCAARGGRATRSGPRALVFAALVVLVGWHYFARSKRSAPAVDAYGLWSAVSHFAATYLRGMVPLLPDGNGAALLVAAIVAGAVLVLASPTARFLVLWTAAALVPYVALAYGERFAYFVHAPAALLLVRVAAEIARRCRWRHGVAAAGWLVVALAVVAALRLPAALDPHRQKGEQCRRVLAFVETNGLAQRPELVLDALPPSLDNGLESMLELYCGRCPRIVYLMVARRPPFLIYLDRVFAGMPSDTPVLVLTDGEPGVVDKALLVGDLVPVPMLSLAGAFEVAADDAAAAALLRAAGGDVVQQPILFAAPPCAVAPPGTYDVEIPAFGATEVTFGVDCASPCLLVIASPQPFDLEPRGRVLVDGEPVAVQRANLLFHAACVPAGRHRVALRPLVDPEVTR